MLRFRAFEAGLEPGPRLKAGGHSPEAAPPGLLGRDTEAPGRALRGHRHGGPPSSIQQVEFTVVLGPFLEGKRMVVGLRTVPAPSCIDGAAACLAD